MLASKKGRISAFSAAMFLAFVLGGTQVALADSAHFVGSFNISKTNSGLTVSGKAAGLGDGPITAFLTATSVSASYECSNKGGNVAPGQPIFDQNVVGPTVTISPHNGQITFSVTLAAPTPPDPRDACPNGNWRVRLTSLSFSGVVVHVVDANTEITANLGTI